MSLGVGQRIVSFRRGSKVSLRKRSERCISIACKQVQIGEWPGVPTRVPLFAPEPRRLDSCGRPSDVKARSRTMSILRASWLSSELQRYRPNALTAISDRSSRSRTSFANGSAFGPSPWMHIVLALTSTSIPSSERTLPSFTKRTT